MNQSKLFYMDSPQREFIPATCEIRLKLFQDGSNRILSKDLYWFANWLRSRKLKCCVNLNPTSCWKCNFPMSPHVSWWGGRYWLECRSKFPKRGGEVTFPCSVFFFINCAFVRAQNEYLGQFLPNTFILARLKALGISGRNDTVKFCEWATNFWAQAYS